MASGQEFVILISILLTLCSAQSEVKGKKKIYYFFSERKKNIIYFDLKNSQLVKSAFHTLYELIFESFISMLGHRNPFFL